MVPKNSNHFLSLIVPVFRKERIVVENIRQFKAVLDEVRYDYEIIVVIDGVEDKSYELLKAARIPKVKVLAHSQHEGKGFTIREGMAQATGDYVMFIDCGFEINPNSISMLLEHMEWYDADIIVGSKRHPASIVEYSLERKVLSDCAYLLTKILFGINVRDTQAGIKVFRKKVLADILPRVLEKKFMADLEMLVVANRLGYKRIFEAPIRLDYHLGDLTSAGTLKGIWWALIDTAAIFYRANVLHYYDHPHS